MHSSLQHTLSKAAQKVAQAFEDLAVFEPAAYDWITYEKLEKENAE